MGYIDMQGSGKNKRMKRLMGEVQPEEVEAKEDEKNWRGNLIHDS